jgi:hypothetical protein
MVDFNYKKLPASGGSPRDVASVVNLMLDGKTNATGTFTLSASTTTTSVTDVRAGTNSVINFTPTTANAAAEVGAGGMFISARADSSFTITHANNSQSDRTFIYTIIG